MSAVASPIGRNAASVPLATLREQGEQDLLAIPLFRGNCSEFFEELLRPVCIDMKNFEWLKSAQGIVA